jgi:CHAT domain-containing protein
MPAISDAPFTQLPGAKLEGHKIQELLPGSRIYELHIATHGFSALPTDDSDNDEGMFHAGLVFAGANDALQGVRNDASAGDAILTGEETATLNLMGTALVVLSACRSGLGKTVAGEGVFGLHRAFASAGARCVITSLWKIPDAETRELMTLLYQELLGGKPRAAALRESQTAHEGQPFTRVLLGKFSLSW